MLDRHVSEHRIGRPCRRGVKLLCEEKEPVESFAPWLHILSQGRPAKKSRPSF
jgi:hypothetical protein